MGRKERRGEKGKGPYSLREGRLWETEGGKRKYDIRGMGEGGKTDREGKDKMKMGRQRGDRAEGKTKPTAYKKGKMGRDRSRGKRTGRRRLSRKVNF